MKVFISRKIPDSAVKFLSGKEFEVDMFDSDDPVPENEFIRRARFADGIITTLSDKVNRDFIIQLEKCQVIANYAVGYNNIDLKSAANKGIIITNTPDILTDATADLAMALLLACARRIPEGEKLVREGKFTGWQPMLLLGIDLKGKVLGIVGAGRIGQAVAKRATAFGLKVVYYSRNRKPGFESTGAGYLPLDELLKISDIISVHTPLTEETFHLLNEKNLSLVKQTAIIINTGRGEIIDENTLIGLLKEKRIFAAGLDVFENEPDIKKEFYALENVILLPHLGSAAEETRSKMAELCAENIVNVLSGKPAITPVFPV